MRTFEEDLKRNLEDPEFAVGFAHEKVESNKELFKCGVISSLNVTSLNNKTKKSTVRW